MPAIPADPSHTLVGFLDVNFLKAEGAKVLGQKPSDVGLNAEAIVAWLDTLSDARRLRVYRYDGAFSPRHHEYSGQRRFLDAIAYTPGVQLRLGHVAEHPPRLERPVTRALEGAANDIGVDASRLLDAFNARFRWLPERTQKGVDTLIVLDLVRLGQRRAYDIAVLIAGDRDLAEAMRSAQDEGRRIVVAHPVNAGIAPEVKQLADLVIELDAVVLRRLLVKPSRT